MNISNHKILNTSSIDMTEISSKSVALIVTSPPYPMIEMWDDCFSMQEDSIKCDLKIGKYESAYKKMHIVLNKVWDECDRVLIDNGFVCINIGDATRSNEGEFKMYPNHMNIIQYFQEKGYSVLPDILWRKPTNSPNKFMGSGMYPAGAYVTYEHEYILIFRKGGKRIFKSVYDKNTRQKSAYFWEERNTWFSDLWEVKGSTQILKSEGSRERSGAFPFEIPYRLINMYSVKGDTVLDPFLGLGTTTMACLATERNSVGFEIDKEISSLINDNLLNSKCFINSRIRKRIDDHIKFIGDLNGDKHDKCYKNEAHNFLVKTRQEIKAQINFIESLSNEGNKLICKYNSFE